jgi:hypothetical protein
MLRSETTFRAAELTPELAEAPTAHRRWTAWANARLLSPELDMFAAALAHIVILGPE